MCRVVCTLIICYCYCVFLVVIVLFATSIDLTTSTHSNVNHKRANYHLRDGQLQPNTSLNVSFHQSSYSVNEGDQLLQPQLILNEPSSTNITVLIKSIDITATGMYINIVLNNIIHILTSYRRRC